VTYRDEISKINGCRDIAIAFLFENKGLQSSHLFLRFQSIPSIFCIISNTVKHSLSIDEYPTEQNSAE
jgi:hypothetical protein